tara:strand:- start:947 stop:1441 length:495 start_codon:yes stop_codon:yes gene_type:complete
MKQYFVLGFTLFLLSNSFAQQDDQKIRYFFGHKIDTILYKESSKIISQLEEKEALAIACRVHDTTLIIKLFTYCKTCEIYNQNGDIEYWNGYLALNTNRYYMLNKLKVPILFKLDASYGAVKIYENGGVNRATRIVGEFETQIIIRASVNGRYIYSVEYINIPH